MDVGEIIIFNSPNIGSKIQANQQTKYI